MELRIEELTKKFKDKIAVNKFTVTLDNGVYGLLGPNGSGKTTLIKMLVDVVNPTGGNIYLDGIKKEALGEQYREVLGYLPQNIGFYENFTAEKFLYYIAALKGIDKIEAEKKIDSLLRYVNLEKDRKKKIAGFSGGMKERLGIVQALLNDPKILILDEPTAGLDPNERIRFKNLIGNISKDKIIIISTHIVSDIEFLANEILIMKDGELLKKDRPDILLENVRRKVWKLQIDEEELLELNNTYKIANTWRDKDSVVVRIIGDKKPGPLAEEIEPNLEDLFLYYFNKGSGENEGIS